MIDSLTPSKTRYKGLLSHLFNDKILILNATNSNSIFEEISRIESSNNSHDKTIWILGDDNWAQDKGFSEINNVIASSRNLNFLIFDDGIFSHPHLQKKDLGAIAMTYDKSYVASVAIGSSQEHTQKAFVAVLRADKD